VEVALMQIGLQEAGAAMEPALRSPDGLAALVAAYRRFAIEHPHPYRLMTTRPLPRERLAPGVEAGAAAPLMAAVGGDLDRARAVWGMAHGAWTRAPRARRALAGGCGYRRRVACRHSGLRHY
jgi:hypothetical protein